MQFSEGNWRVELSQGSNSIIVYQSGALVGKYDLLKEPYCERCAFPKPTNECSWHWFDTSVDRTYAIGIYYPTRRKKEHQGSLLSQHIIKLKTNREYAIPLGLSIALLIKGIYEELSIIDIITFIPKHEKEYKEDQNDFTRYNQAEELAHVIGKRINKDVVDLLIKSKPFSQSKKRWSERIIITSDIYSSNVSESELKGKNILLIDDVRTSGGTANRCANILKRSGANKVYLFVAGRDVGDEQIS